MTYADLLVAARCLFGVNEITRVDDLHRYLKSFGAVPLSFGRYRSDLVDEFVVERLVVLALTLKNGDLLRARATGEELKIFVADPNAEFDPLEYGEDQLEWTTFAHEVDILERIHILVERDERDPDRVGNFRVYGAGQWLRESLWAATGVVPRDPGAPAENSTLFGDAFVFKGRERFAAAPA
jgi:hypothetical protein